MHYVFDNQSIQENSQKKRKEKPQVFGEVFPPKTWAFSEKYCVQAKHKSKEILRRIRQQHISVFGYPMYTDAHWS